MVKLSKLKGDESGNGILICIFVLFFMLGVGGLVVDASILYKAKGEMRKAANAAALSGAQVVFNGTNDEEKEAAVKKVACDILEANNEIDSWPPAKLIDSEKKNKVNVTLDKNVSLYFMRIFGMKTVEIKVTSSAVRELATEMGGVTPLGVEEGTILNVGEVYTLKDKNVGDSPGWFGFINLDGDKNPHNIADLINNGYPGKVSVDQIFDKIPGDKASVEKDLVSRTTPIIIIIYEMIDPSKSDSLRVKGFAYCKLTLDPKNKKIFKGEFIKTINDSSISGTTDEYLIYKSRLVE